MSTPSSFLSQDYTLLLIVLAILHIFLKNISIVNSFWEFKQNARFSKRPPQYDAHYFRIFEVLTLTFSHLLPLFSKNLLNKFLPDLGWRHQKHTQFHSPKTRAQLWCHQQPAFLFLAFYFNGSLWIVVYVKISSDNVLVIFLFIILTLL